jgi:hypothetical protein
MIAPALRLRRLDRTAVLVRSLGLVTAALLVIDAYVHLHDAHLYGNGAGGTVTEGSLFRLEGAVAIVIALALLVRPHWVVWLLALLVAASAATAVYLYTYVDVGALGPLPDMYEPTWALPGKRLTAAAEIAATATAGLGLALTLLAGRRAGHHAGNARRAEPGELHIDEGMSYADLPCGLRRRRTGDSRDLHRRRG